MKVLVWYSGEYVDQRIAFTMQTIEFDTVPRKGERIVMDNGRTYWVDSVVWYPFSDQAKVAVNVKDMSEGD